MQFPFPVFFILITVGVLGSIAVMPYAFTLNREHLATIEMSKQKLVILSTIQAAVLVTITTGLGLLMSPEIGLGAPMLETIVTGGVLPSNISSLLILAIFVGSVSAILVVVINQYLFMPHLPAAFHKAQEEIALWKRFLAGFYGAITEEILTRLFLMTLITWLLGKVWIASNGLPADGAYWLSIIIAALIFGLGHLPATRALAPLTPLIILRALLLNGIVAVGTGYLYWQHGLLVAMLAHFTADMVLHVFAPMFIHSDTSTDLSNVSQTVNLSN